MFPGLFFGLYFCVERTYRIGFSFVRIAGGPKVDRRTWFWRGRACFLNRGTAMDFFHEDKNRAFLTAFLRNSLRSDTVVVVFEVNSIGVSKLKHRFRWGKT